MPNRPVVEERFLRVALDTPVARLFDYRMPLDGDLSQIQPGARVLVPFGRRALIGVIIDISDTTTLAIERLKRVTRLVDTTPIIDSATLELILWAAEYYHHPIGEAVAAALPAALRAGHPAEAVEERWRLTRDAALAITAQRRLGARQREMAHAFLHADSLDPASLQQVSPNWRETLRDFMRRGWVERFEVSPARVAPATIDPRPGPILTAAQASAVADITHSLGSFAAHLLHGVTGSGKTEVYLRSIATALARGEQALVLVPEIALTPQAVERFQTRFQTPLAILHSGLTENERLSMWRLARTGQAPIIIGTRSAVFVPMARPGIIIVDEEHDGSYKQQEGFRYSARDLALKRGQQHRIPVVLGSATPSLESLHQANRGRYRYLSLPERAGSAGAPMMSLVDLRVHEERHGIATPSVLAIQRHLAAGSQVLLYLNRRGFAPALFCPGCGWSAPCAGCDARMTVHLRHQRLICHHCGAEAAVPFGCPACGTEVRPVGQGTERIEDTIDELFPRIPIVRIDRDTIHTRGQIKAALDRVHSGEARILVGTQMLTKGHDFPDVTLVVVLNADQGLFGTDFRAAERLAQSIVQVAGRAGRASKPGEVLIQTACPDHPLLQRLLTSGYAGFAEGALLERAEAGWPPFSRLALLRAEAPARDEVMSFLAAAHELFSHAAIAGVRLLGPAPAAMERRAGRYRAQLLLESRDRGPLHRLLSACLTGIEALPNARRIRWTLDVDPIDVM